jgi:hypothetical protein
MTKAELLTLIETDEDVQTALIKLIWDTPLDVEGPEMLRYLLNVKVENEKKPLSDID